MFNYVITAKAWNGTKASTHWIGNKQLEDKIHSSVLEILWMRNKPRAAVVVFRFRTGDWRMYSPRFRGLANMHLNEFQP